jgi:Helitron helicase-like domain at N-terminus
MIDIQNVLREHNVFLPLYRQAYEVLTSARENGAIETDLSVRLHCSDKKDQRRYNLPTSNEVAVILPGNESESQATRDVVIYLRGGPLQRIHEAHPAYLPLHYVLLFPRGELGWSPTLGPSLMEFHSFRLFMRRAEYSTILRGGKLFQEYLVDAWATTEQNRLRYIRTNQDALRADVYQDLANVAGNNANDEINLNNLGQRVILPSSFSGSARNMFEIFQDSMAITRYYRHPDIFLTMTASPSWPEITRELLPEQRASDRPDLVARIFELKRRALLKDIKQNGIFGKAVAHVFTIEFQKRGLPHIHILIFLHNDDKTKEPAQVNRIVCAEFPDKDQDPILFNTVLRCMIHGPCGYRNLVAPCMQDGKCQKRYPKEFQPATTMDAEGYPLYRRRNDERTLCLIILI